MEKPILLVGGGKGGVGKSLLSVALVDYLSVTDRRPFLVETDTSVPDVYKTYDGEIDAELVNLDEREGWIELLNLVESLPEYTIVINTGARNQTGINNFGKTLRKALPQLKRQLVVFWLIDRKRESLELLSDFAEALPEATVHIARNMYLGTEGKFELYNGSKMRAVIEQGGTQKDNANNTSIATNLSDIGIEVGIVLALSFSTQRKAARSRKLKRQRAVDAEGNKLHIIGLVDSPTRYDAEDGHGGL